MPALHLAGGGRERGVWPALGDAVVPADPFKSTSAGARAKRAPESRHRVELSVSTSSGVRIRSGAAKNAVQTARTVARGTTRPITA
jgi:hypothetical protein